MGSDGEAMAGYFVLHTKWHTLERLSEYQQGAQQAVAEYGGKFLAYDVRPEVIEGKSEHAATVILEFADLETAKAWYISPAYQKVLQIRLESSNLTIMADHSLPQRIQLALHC